MSRAPGYLSPDEEIVREARLARGIERRMAAGAKSLARAFGLGPVRRGRPRNEQGASASGALLESLSKPTNARQGGRTQ